MNYENGLVIALLLWLFDIVWSIIILNSLYARNLAKIGMRLSMLTLRPKLNEEYDRARPWWRSALKFSLLAVMGLLNALLSWLGIAIRVSQIAWVRYKLAGRPAVAREAEWKLKNIDLTFDQIVETLYAMNVGLGVEKRGLEDFKDEFRALAGSAAA